MNSHDRLALVRLIAAAHDKTTDIYNRLSRQASARLGTPVALISLVEEDSDLIYGQTGLPEFMIEAGKIEAQPSFCQLTITADKPLAINDAQLVPTLRLFPSVAKLGVRAHLGMPLRIDGQPVGNCCVLDFKPRVWTKSDISALSELAALALVEIVAEKAALKNSVDALKA